MELSIRGTLRVLRKSPTLYGLAWALFLAVIGILGVALWAHFNDPSAGQMVFAAYIIHCIAILFGGITGSRAAAERGWYYGGLVGLLYAAIMVCIGLVVYNTFSVDVNGLFRILLMTLIGCFGGIIGVNTVSD
jgi:putative membrane protein (TIGR04086 family)